MDNFKEDISVLNTVRDNLKKEIDVLNTRHESLKTAIHEQEIRLESNEKVHEAKLNTLSLDAEQNRNKNIGSIEARSTNLDTREQIIRDREMEIERRQLQMLDLEERIKQLNEDRSVFRNYKDQTLKELQKAKNTIEESKVAMDKVIAKEDELKAREKALRVGNDRLMQAHGVFEKQKRDWEMSKNGELISL